MTEVSAFAQTKAVQLSIVICTFNRAQLLDRTLSSLTKQTAIDDIEVVVVDNHSTDATSQVVEKWKRYACINVVGVTESTQGLSHARNAGIARSRSALIAFLDDDVYAYPDWAECVMDLFSQRREINCLAGPVDPDWAESAVPTWINEELLYSIGVGNYGTEQRYLTDREYPIGANMAFRAHVFRQVGMFDTRLGRTGVDLLSCEEIEFVSRLRKRGERVFYDPSMRVAHYVPTHRASKAYFLKRRQADGRSIAVWEAIRGGKLLLGRNLLIRLALAVMRDVLGYVFLSILRKEKSFTFACRLSKTGGYVLQAVKILGHGI